MREVKFGLFSVTGDYAEALRTGNGRIDNLITGQLWHVSRSARFIQGALPGDGIMLKLSRMLIIASGMVFVLLFAAVPSHAVVLSGVVTDQTDHPLSGVWVTAKNLDRKMAVSVLTDPRGRYRIQSLFPRTYRLRV